MSIAGTPDDASPEFKARPEYPAKMDVLSRAMGKVLAQLRDDPEFQHSFALCLRESLDEDFDGGHQALHPGRSRSCAGLSPS